MDATSSHDRGQFPFNGRHADGGVATSLNGTLEQPTQVEPPGSPVLVAVGRELPNGLHHSEADERARSKNGTTILVTVNRELAAEMKRLRLDVAYHLDDGVKEHVDRRRVVVVYRDEGEAFARQCANILHRKCYCEGVGILDLKEIGFDGEPESWVDWYDEAIGKGQFDDRFDFYNELDRRAVRIEAPVSTEAVPDNEQGDPVGELAGPAYHGPLGKLAIAAANQTEASPAFVLMHLLAYFSIAIGKGSQDRPGPYIHLDGAGHDYLNIFTVLVGPSGEGRKNTAKRCADAVFSLIDPEFVANNITSGLTSDRGLLEAMRDPSHRSAKDGGPDEGVSDKRLLMIETEFASVLKHGDRDGETLCDLINQFYDGQNIISKKTKSPVKVTRGHLGIVGHTTDDAMDKNTTTSNKSDGFLGRFVVIFDSTRKHMAFPGNVAETISNYFSVEIESMKDALRTARDRKLISLDHGLEKRWESLYHKLRSRPAGRIGQLFVRFPSNVKRLAALYALADGMCVILPRHLHAAEAILDHAARSLKFIFAGDIDERGDKLLAALREAGEGGMTKTQIAQRVFNGHGDSASLERILTKYQAYKWIKLLPPDKSKRGRPSARYRIMHPKGAPQSPPPSPPPGPTAH
jgi:Protein of unknown function (DUF3987)